MRSAKSADKGNDESCMLNTERLENTTKNGAIEIPENHLDSERKTDSKWLIKKFKYILFLLTIISIISLLVLCITLYILLQFNQSRVLPQTSPKTSSDTDVPIDVHTNGNSTSKASFNEYPWHDSTCNSVGKCKKSGYEKPPLLIISFDGFSYKYMEKNIMKSLEYFSSCGVKAEKVIPCFPSRTFPNHYAIATGLYPESHGIVDNNIYDPTISPQPESTKTTKHNNFWMGTPIWKAYHDQTKRKTSCLFWPGCAYNISGYKPENSPPYDKSLKLENRFEMVHKWLADEDHPELVLAYFEQPDTAGHHQKSEKDIEDALIEIDGLLNTFLTDLHKDGLLDCINIAIVSDHGMQLLNNLVYIPDYVDSKNVVATQGVIGRLFSANITIEELAEPFSCQKVDGVRLFTRGSMPVRKHHAKIPRVGDVILQGEPGTTFDIKRRGMLAADHGYDIIHDNMHTIFFARGPAFKQNFTLPPFQHIEYMNLWTELLNLKPVPNNGSIGFMDQILVKPPSRKSFEESNISECELNQQSYFVNPCKTCRQSVENSMNEAISSCSSISNDYLQFKTPLTTCSKNYCNTTIWKMNKSNIVLEEIARNDLLKHFDCPANVKKYIETSTCVPPSDNQAYLSSSPYSLFGQVSGTEFNATGGFQKFVLEPLNILTLNYARKFEKIWTISGLASDENIDGVADIEQSSLTHFYRSIFYCSSHINSECTKMDVISFIFPLIDTDINCLKSDDFLMEYSARLMDVELISGLVWTPRSISNEEYHRIRIHINMKLI